MRFGGSNWIFDECLASTATLLAEAGFWDAYHMNIEEAYPAGVVMEAGERLFLMHKPILIDRLWPQWVWR